ncbi:MAG: hypothetical protein WKF37_10280 [Bryobacteraceae bacterium]
MARIEGRPAVVVANDATVKAGAWWPETIAGAAGNRHAQPAAYRLPGRFRRRQSSYQDGIFPASTAPRASFITTLMRSKLRSANCGGDEHMRCRWRYLPALSGVIIMVREPASWVWRTQPGEGSDWRID